MVPIRLTLLLTLSAIFVLGTGCSQSGDFAQSYAQAYGSDSAASRSDDYWYFDNSQIPIAEGRSASNLLEPVGGLIDSTLGVNLRVLDREFNRIFVFESTTGDLKRAWVVLNDGQKLRYELSGTSSRLVLNRALDVHGFKVLSKSGGKWFFDNQGQPVDAKWFADNEKWFQDCD